MGRPLDESDLIGRAKRGDTHAYEELVYAHQGIAFRTAYVIVGNAADAEDAAQDGFVKAWRALARFREGAPLRPWLLTIVANEARNRRRAAGRRQALTLRIAQAEQAGASAETEALQQQSRGALLDAISRLKTDDRLVLGCRYLLELSEAETAAALGVPAGTVKSRTSRALARLRGEVAA